jgi:hypothetical protein
MTIALLDINDSNLQLWHGDRQLQSPGYALLDEQQYRFGNSAREAARLHPRKINTRFWWQLNTQELQPALGPARHTGDLVHAHLLDIHQQGGEPGEILLSVSSSLQREQLALLLGIIQQCPFNAVGLVNRSVALASAYGGPGKVYHLEIQLHQAVISELAQSNGQIELQRTIPLPGCGLLQLQERLVEIIAAAFIRQTRFDPRRKAETEQLLYDALPGALRELHSASETNLEIGGYRARIVRSELAAAGTRLFDSAPGAMGVLAPEDRIIVDPIATLLPGLQERIPQTEVLAADALPRALKLHMDNLIQRNETLKFITTLPCLGETPPTHTEDIAGEPDNTPSEPAPAEQATPAVPTHVLLGATASPLQAGGTTLNPELELHCDHGRWILRGHGIGSAQVNNEAYTAGVALGAGDSISWGAATAAVLIEVRS